MLDNLKENEIQYQTSDEEEIAPMLLDRTSIEQWRVAGLPNDTFFTENAIAIHNNSK